MLDTPLNVCQGIRASKKALAGLTVRNYPMKPFLAIIPWNSGALTLRTTYQNTFDKSTVG